MTTMQSYSKSRGTIQDLDEGQFYTRTSQHWNTDSYVQTVHSMGAANVSYQTTNGVNIKDFHKRRNAGELLPHTSFRQYSVEGERSGDYDVTAEYASPSNPEKTNLKMPGYLHSAYNVLWFPPLSDLEALLEDSDLDPEVYVQEAAAKAYSSGFDSLTFLAEMHKIRRLFTRSLERAIRIVKQMRKDYATIPKLRQQFKSFIDFLRDVWLEWRYGWRILIYDLIAIEKLISDLGEEPRDRVSERQGQSITWMNQTTPVNSVSNWGSYDLSQIEAVEISVRGSVTADFTQTGITANPLLTIWELVPYSFVFDWFIDIGRWISSQSLLALSSNWAASFGTQVRVVREITTINQTLNTDDPNNVFSGFWTHESTSTSLLQERTPTDIPSTPLWELNLDVYKYLDLIALLLGLRDGLSNPYRHG